MTELSYQNWASMTDRVLAEQIGAFVKHQRLEQNKTQDILAHDAGISRSTLSLLEKGETVTMATLIQVLRILDQLQVMDAFVVQKSISPIAMAKLERNQRKRSRNKKTKDTGDSVW